VAITADMVKELRQATGAGVLDCRRALETSGGDIEKATSLLREKGLVAAAKKAERETKEGMIGSYVHMGAKLAALIEVSCESDFVARTAEFQTLAKDLAMQVVAARPNWVRPEDVPAEVVEQVKQKFQTEVEGNKPPQVLERIITGKLNKFYEENCLLEQPFIRDDSVKVKDIVTAAIAKMGENIVIRRFCRMEMGD
jgi:elongation factor Ts